MIGKIPTWWENSVLRNRNMMGKIPTWWENSVRGRKKVFRCMDHLVLRHPSYMRGFTFPFSLSVVAGLLRPRLFPFGKLSKAKSAAQALTS